MKRKLKFTLRVINNGIQIRHYEDHMGSSTDMWILMTSPTTIARTFIKRLKMDDQDWLQIHSFWVHQDLRGKGYGRVLIREMIRRANGIGANIILRVRPYNKSPFDIEALTEFYAKYGFVSIKDYGIRDKRGPRWMIQKKPKYARKSKT